MLLKLGNKLTQAVWGTWLVTTHNLRFSTETVRECNETFFYLHPKSVTASPGDHVMFTCSVKGCSVPKITWLKNGLANVDEEGKSYQGQENATSVLTIDSIEIRNSGNYSCQATSSKGNITSREAVLIIKGKFVCHIKKHFRDSRFFSQGQYNNNTTKTQFNFIVKILSAFRLLFGNDFR